MTATEYALRRRHRDDFTYYAPRCLRIKPKAGGEVALSLNKAQLYLHERLEQQMREEGRIRALVLKGRQQGCSTYVEARFFWKVSHRFGVKAYIMAHLDKASTNLFDMAKLYHEKCPDLLRPATSASNGHKLKFSALNSGYEIATAKSQATGRSGTYQYFHGSEVAFWPVPEQDEDGSAKNDILGGALEAVPDLDNTEVILESTANGKRGIFYEKCIAALLDDEREKQGKTRLSDYILVFIPWFWQDEYRRPVPRNFELTAEEEEYKALHGLDDQQMVWRRRKIGSSKLSTFKREYPATALEAFEASVEGALLDEDDFTYLEPGTPLPRMKKIVVGIDPSGGKEKANDAQGIVGGGLGTDGIIYIFDDVTCKKDPLGWAREAIGLHDRLKGDLLVGEGNFGGDMIESNLKTVREFIPYKKVTASRGKDVRAQPVASLYKQGKIVHVRKFEELENEWVTWVPDISKWSPNRLDADVWVVTELTDGFKLPDPSMPTAIPVGMPFSV